MNIQTLSKITFLLLMMFFSTFAIAKTTAATSDAAITTNVTNQISSNNLLTGTHITVNTANGVVTLVGNLDSDTQADTATQIAQSIAGVKDVDASRLTIKGSEHPVADAIITAKVKGMFVQQKLFGDKDIAAMGITVETNNGVVSLSGTADNQDQINNAIQIAKSVAGVTDVKTAIQIKI